MRDFVGRALEQLGRVALLRRGDLLDLDLGRAGADGVRDAEIRLDEDGEILVRSKLVFQGYYKNPEADAVRRKAGWYRSGDLAWRDASGFFDIARQRIIEALAKDREALLAGETESDPPGAFLRRPLVWLTTSHSSHALGDGWSFR